MPQRLDIPKSISKILNADGRLISALFKDKSKEIIDFLNSIDLTHPDLKSKEISKNSDTICSIIDLAQDALVNSVNFDFGDLSYLIGDITNPIRSGRQLRFLKNKNKSRLQRKPFKFSSYHFYSSCMRMWQSLPSSFSSCAADKEIEEQFRSIGCEALADSYKAIMGSLGPMTDLGLRITMEQALCILAKQNNFFVSIDRIGRSRIVYTDNSLYKPVVAPLESFSELVSEEISNKICGLDHPYSLFDHHLLLVPFVQKPGKSEDEFLTGDFHVAILGEKDGVCYFVCDWTKLMT